MVNIDLSIVIPTYNRRRYLEELIPNILEEYCKIDHQSCRIEIVVNDNASTDGSENYLKGYAKKTNADWFRYYRNSENVGGDRNFILSVQRAKGRYVWLFGDDELIVADGINKICRVIQKEPVSLLILNDEKNIAELKKPNIFRNYQELINFYAERDPHFVLAHTLITANIFLKDYFDSKMAEKTIACRYSHMHAIMHNLASKGGRVYCFNEPIIKIRQERPEFADPPKNLGWKQACYINYIGRLFKNRKIFMYSIIFFIKTIKHDLFNFKNQLIKSFNKKLEEILK